MTIDRTIAPSFKRTSQFQLIEPVQVTLPNGVTAYFVSGGLQNVIKIELIFNAGRWHEHYWGAAHFTSNLLLKGTQQKKSFEIVQIFDFYGAHVEISPGLDVVSVSLYALTKNLEPTLTLLLEVLSSSIFPEKELAQSKSIYLQNLKVNNEKTSFLASKLIRKNLFGEVHPYGKELEESEVNTLSREDLIAHFNNFFKDFFIIVSGRIEETNQKLIADTFATLPLQLAPDKKIDTRGAAPLRLVVEKSGSVQSSIRVGKRFIGRNHPDYFDVLLLNHILGGYFGSRLMKNIREDKGLSYGIHSSIHTLKNDTYLVIGSDVNKENLDLTFAEIRKELRRLRTEKMGRDELEIARNHFIGSLQSEITTPFAHADKVKNIILYSLPKNYYQNLISRLDTLQPEDLLQVADKYFNEESFFETAVG